MNELEQQIDKFGETTLTILRDAMRYKTALEMIAAGHKDPRALAEVALKGNK